MIDLYKPRSEVLVDHHIKAKDLKAHRVVNTLRLADTIHVIHVRLTDNYGFNNNILDLFPNFVWITSLLVDDLHDCKKGSLVAGLLLVLIVVLISVVTVIPVVIITTRFLLLVVLLEIRIHFVDRVVGQVHVHIVYVGGPWFLIRFRSEPSQALLVDEDAQRIQPV